MITVQTHHLFKRFGGIQALRDVCMRMEPGKITGIIGPNGSGKSTLVHVLSGMVPASEGSVTVGKHAEIHGMRPYQAVSYGISRTFQDSRLFLQMTVLDNVLLALGERRPFYAFFERTARAQTEKADAILARTGLLEKKDSLAGKLSYGQRKLLELSRILALDMDIVFLDEPFSGLFPEMTETVCAIVADLKRKWKTIALIEHDMDLVRRLADRIAVMAEGGLLTEGTAEEVLRDIRVAEVYLGN